MPQSYAREQIKLILEENRNQLDTGNIEGIQKKLTELLEFKGLKLEDSLEAKRLLCRVFFRLGQYKQGIDLAYTSLHEAIDEGNHFQQFQIIAVVVDALLHTSRYDEAESHVDRMEKLIEQICKHESNKREILNAKVAYERGLISLFKGERRKCIKIMTRCKEILEPLGEDRELAKTYNILGWSFAANGKFETAKLHFKKALEITARSNLRPTAVAVMNNLATIEQETGELDIALEHYEKCVIINSELKRIIAQAINFYNIGTTYAAKGDLSNALKHHKKALKLIVEKDDTFTIAQILHEIVVISLESNDTKTATKYLKQLHELADESKDWRAVLHFEVSKAVSMRYSGEIDNQDEVKRIFEKYIQADETPFSMKAYLMLNLCDILLCEAKETQEEKIIDDVRKIVTDLDEIAFKQKSYALQAQVIFLRAKVALIELGPKEARRLMHRAQTIAQEKGLVRVAQKISHDYDNLLGKLEEWSKLQKQGTTLRERVELSAIDDTIGSLIRKRGDDTSDDPEEPVMLLFIQKEEGLTVYTKDFQDESEVDKDLFGAFLSALNTFVKEALSTENIVERIKVGNYTLAMTPIKSLILCYVFRGYSYHAIQKLNKMTSIMLEHPDCIKSLLSDIYLKGSGKEVELESCIQQAFA